MIVTKENQPAAVFICGTKADVTEMGLGYSFTVTKFPFVFRIYPACEGEQLYLEINGGAVNWHEYWDLKNATDILDEYYNAIKLMENVAADFIRDMLSIQLKHTGCKVY